MEWAHSSLILNGSYLVPFTRLSFPGCIWMVLPSKRHFATPYVVNNKWRKIFTYFFLLMFNYFKSSRPCSIPFIMFSVSPHACNQYIDTFTSSITSPGYPNGYSPNLRCAYTIRRADPRICKVLLEIRLIDFGRHHAGGPCRGDYLEFPDLSRTCVGYPSRSKSACYFSKLEKIYIRKTLLNKIT